MVMRFLLIKIFILFQFQLYANGSWVKDLSFDNIDIWKNGSKRISVEVKNNKNKLENYNKEKVQEYLARRNKILKYADFSNFQTSSLKFQKNKDEIRIDNNGSYLNSRSVKTFFKEIHILSKNKSIITMITSQKKLTKEDINDFKKKLNYIEETNK